MKKKKVYKQDPTRDKTLGEIAIMAAQSKPEEATLEELGSAMTNDFMDRIRQEVQRGVNLYHGDFFIIMLTKSETVIPNAVAAYFGCSAGCPTPNYDQTVYHYRRADDELYLIWTIPNKEWCLYLYENALLFDKEFHGIIGYVMDFADGKLFQKACILNEQKAQQLAKVA